jgi:hypothetical protein
MEIDMYSDAMRTASDMQQKSAVYRMARPQVYKVGIYLELDDSGELFLVDACKTYTELNGYYERVAPAQPFGIKVHGRGR